jgi:hypothetical protein
MKNVTQDRQYENVEFKPVEFFKFTDEKKVFEGKFIEHRKVEAAGDKAGWEALIFEDESGIQHGLPTHVQILQGVKEKGVGYYRIEFLGKKQTENGKEQNLYTIGFSS